MTHRGIFATALARSGAGLLSHLLSAHPHAVLARNPFLELFRSWRDAVVAEAADPELLAACPPGSPLADHHFRPQAPRLMDLLLGSGWDQPLPADLEGFRDRLRARAALESADLAPHVEVVTGMTHGELLDGLLEMIAEVRGAPEGSWVGLQEPWVADAFPSLARRHPEARFVMLMRDPRAVVTSLKRIARTYPDQVVQTLSYARHWRKYAALAHEYADPTTPRTEVMRGRFTIVRFEDLTTDPGSVASHLCEFLGIRFAADMVDPTRFHDHNTGRPFTGNSSFGELGASIDNGASDRWRTAAPAGLAEAVEWLCGPDMSLLGYTPELPTADDDVLRWLAVDAATPTRWRSDTGDLVTDLGDELLRRALLAVDAVQLAELGEDLVRRCFLFTHMPSRLRDVSARAPRTTA